MGEAGLHTISHQLIINSVFFFYGDAATKELSWQIASDISKHWNEPKAKIKIGSDLFDIQFDIDGIYEPDLDPEKVWYNDNPRFNFFRIEEFATGNISFVDGIGCNSGYFKLDNLLQTSTTAAHEYGHTLGLVHPTNLDIRGMATPGIMYPRGTICDPPFQYDPNAEPGKTGGTLNPAHRRVLTNDIEDLKLHKLLFNNGRAIVGEFSSLYHEKHTPAVI
ncbi:MAG TPA: peptidase M10 [Niastella sp.]